MIEAPRAWREERAAVRAVLAACGIADAEREARWMVEVASGLDAAELAGGGDDERASLRAHESLQRMCERRCAGEPLQYVLGSWSFRGLDLMVDRRVLIPRPETEWVVEVALREVEASGVRRGPSRPAPGATPSVTVADLGTGSGAIAIALAAELPDAEVWATDASEDALAVARANVAGQAATRVRVAAGSWFSALPTTLRGTLHLVVSNPPYVADDERAALPREVVEHEPAGALFAGPAGTEVIDLLVDEAIAWLRPGGVLVCELAPHQAAHAGSRARAVGYARVEVVDDLTGRPRVLVAVAPVSPAR